MGGLSSRSAFGRLPSSVLARHGYRGCLASFTFSHTPLDLLADSRRSHAVTSGCPGQPPPASSPTSERDAGWVCRAGRPVLAHEL